eukprot:jgi/Chlat1/8868/Chrsp92S08193
MGSARIARSNSKSSAMADEPVPEALACPVCFEIMSDPVLLETGHCYDRTCIEQWFRQGSNTCPLTGQVLQDVNLVTVLPLKHLCQDWAVGHGVKLPVAPHGHAAPVKSVINNNSVATCAPASPSPMLQADQLSKYACQATLQGHVHAVHGVAVMHGTLLTASADSSIKVWVCDEKAWRKGDVEYECVATLQGHRSGITALVAGIHTLYSSSLDRTVKLWEQQSSRQWQCVETFTHEQPVTAIALCEEQDLLFSNSLTNLVHVWKLSTGSKIAVLETPSAVQTLAASASTLYCALQDNSIAMWALPLLTEQNNTQHFSHGSQIACMAVAPRRLFCGTMEGDIKVHYFEADGTIDGTATISCGHPVTSLLPVGTLLIAGLGNGDVAVYSVIGAQNRRTVAYFEGAHSYGAVLALAVDGEVLFSGSEDATVKVWH